jgi:hypothetical protein
VNLQAIQTSNEQAARSSAMSLATSCAVLAVLIGPVALLIAAFCNRRLSTDTVVVAAVGGGICWLAASLALAATFLGNRYRVPVQGMLAGMLFRLGLPLAAVILLPKLSDSLTAKGITTTILGAYLVALAMETVLAVRMIPPQSPTAVTHREGHVMRPECSATPCSCGQEK